MALPALAIEKPPVDNGIPQANKAKLELEGEQREQQPKSKKVAMLGLGAGPVSEMLALHLDLEPGTGLSIFRVIPGSAAEKAGVKKHDVLTHFAGRAIGSVRELHDAVMACKPGDEVVLNYIHRGKKVEQKTILGERIEREEWHAPQRGLMRNGFFKGALRNLPENDRQRIEALMNDNFRRLEKEMEQGGFPEGLLDFLKRAELDQGKQGPQGDDLAKGLGEALELHFKSASSVTLMDEDGSVTMKTLNGKKTVVVKDEKGNIVFEGPYQTEQDKAAIAEDVLERIERLDFDQKKEGGLGLKILPNR